MHTVAPSSLGPIDAVEIVSLHGVDPRRVDYYMLAATDAPHVRLTGPEARRIATLWRTLPAGDAKRCHIPPFGRFFLAGRLICQASLCWQCNDLFGHAGQDKLSFAFDAASPIASALLQACKAALAG